ncbi:S8 family serine peptidase [Streptomyces clavuligerus]|uniref:Putative secreted subtilisin-like serine protease n=1 Tax=Streptomyces clavuligerus TaxID=1901 RepID=E2Q978_STRCL|nr:S8 family serine peptidase [Streptomyces clavuligerus]ANW17773.1 serine protease [Streptomyces clavuligerus]AXU12325.1 serine protease [Streptomyces clavuligerus]EFG09692.1 Putative secreted subtilisin-like serine protease [Streptomyces clavuligerus]MBY6302204.1 S8 family serine peptidase [Streptomyces clavuligerus]QCS05107.1 serine protease [Streptomyces clavuligerus]
MSSWMSHGRRRSAPCAVRRGLVCAVAMVGAWTTGVVAAAPEAAAVEDMRSQQWYLDAMKVEKVWSVAQGEGVKVAVIDTGVNPSTRSLKGQVLKGLDLTGAPGDETDDYEGHGTTMAELIAGTGAGGGLQGLAPKAKIIPYRIALDEFQEEHKTGAFDGADAIRAAADGDAQIISMSFGSEFPETKEQQAIEYAARKGKLLFAAVGNTGDEDNEPEYPALYPEVVGVSASSPEGRIDDYSQHGQVVDLAAPGSDIPGWCDTTFTRYCDSDGTSAATAVASATAALIWSANPDWTANQVLRVMFESAAKGKDGKATGMSRYSGYGVVRPGAHLNRGIGKPGDPDISPLTGQRTSGPSGAPKGTASPRPKGTAGAQAGEKTEATADAGDGGGSRTGLIAGGVAAVLAVAAVAVLAVRRRRSA